MDIENQQNHKEDEEDHHKPGEGDQEDHEDQEDHQDQEDQEDQEVTSSQQRKSTNLKITTTTSRSGRSRSRSPSRNRSRSQSRTRSKSRSRSRSPHHNKHRHVSVSPSPVYHQQQQQYKKGVLPPPPPPVSTYNQHPHPSKTGPVRDPFRRHGPQGSKLPILRAYVLTCTQTSYENAIMDEAKHGHVSIYDHMQPFRKSAPQCLPQDHFDGTLHDRSQDAIIMEEIIRKGYEERKLGHYVLNKLTDWVRNIRMYPVVLLLSLSKEDAEMIRHFTNEVIYFDRPNDLVDALSRDRQSNRDAMLSLDGDSSHAVSSFSSRGRGGRGRGGFGSRGAGFGSRGGGGGGFGGRGAGFGSRGGFDRDRPPYYSAPPPQDYYAPPPPPPSSSSYYSYTPYSP